ncbi:DUF2911 domain-containing protein [Fulvivirgaceae bacterium PWU4]|uniref:DUF2911 domain-containing protein n=1 Tax=Chryseosolibacter histidini TaxID=2782349 RepID=A0AAP2DRX4_9BACT|nr:DUF2911 domain-containing protein [Chryseosolibacter histidini]MBT1699284.1 DUF2911 domain-containing protein [Chryseosolibacter histidini]
MKLNILIALALIICIGSACTQKTGTSEHQHGTPASTEAPADTTKKSIPKETHAQVGNAHVMIKYHAPAVRGRTIWGGLVPYGEVWVTGAHSATSLEFDKDLIVADKAISAGKYALFTIPGQEKWTVIINRNWDQHLADEYDQKDDIIRLEVTPQQLPGVQERLKYTVVAHENTGGSIDIRWEKIKISMPFKIK